MAKRPTRSEANDGATEARPKPRARARSARELGGATVANREADPVKLDDAGHAQPENISAALGGSERRVQEAPGDSVASRNAYGANGESPERQPSEDDIRRRAYEMYLERGGSHGGDFDDWVRAENELRGRKR